MRDSSAYFTMLQMLFWWCCQLSQGHQNFLKPKQVTVFIFTVINVLIIKSTHTNLSVLDCYRFFLPSFKETSLNLDLLCSLFTATDNQFILLAQGTCKTLNIFIIWIFLSISTTFNIYSELRWATAGKSFNYLYVSNKYIYKACITVSHTVSSSKAIIPVMRHRKITFCYCDIVKGSFSCDQQHFDFKSQLSAFVIHPIKLRHWTSLKIIYAILCV